MYGIDDPVDESDPSGLDVFLCLWEGSQVGFDTGQHAGIAVDMDAFSAPGSSSYYSYCYADFTPVGNGTIYHSREFGNHLYSTPGQVRGNVFSSIALVHSQAKDERREPEHILDVPADDRTTLNVYMDIESYIGRYPSCPYGNYRFDDHNCTDFVIKILTDNGISMAGYEPQQGDLFGPWGGLMVVNSPHALYQWGQARCFYDFGSASGSWHNKDHVGGYYWFGPPIEEALMMASFGLDGDLSVPAL